MLTIAKIVLVFQIYFASVREHLLEATVLIKILFSQYSMLLSKKLSLSGLSVRCFYFLAMS